MSYEYVADTVSFTLEEAKTKLSNTGSSLSSVSENLGKLVTTIEDMQKEVNDISGSYVASDYLDFEAAVKEVNSFLMELDGVLENFDEYFKTQQSNTRSA